MIPEVALLSPHVCAHIFKCTCTHKNTYIKKEVQRSVGTSRRPCVRIVFVKVTITGFDLVQYLKDFSDSLLILMLFECGHEEFTLKNFPEVQKEF